MADLKSILGVALANISKINGVAIASVKSWDGVTLPSGFNWETIFTYTTNATATLVTNWVGAAISTSPNVPALIPDEGKPVIVNAATTFNGKTTLTNCYINASVAFVGNTMTNAFRSCSNLIEVDLIPNSVTSMYYTFGDCTNLVNAPTIPANVTTMAFTFYSCTNLVNAPTIPANVTNMYSTFRYCSKLVNAPTIPANVTNMAYTFQSCTNLVGDITVVNANVTNFTNCFYGCNASLAKTLYCPTGSASYNLAINVSNGINGVTVIAY